MKMLVNNILMLCIMALFTDMAQAIGGHAHRIVGPFASGPDVTRACLECHMRDAEDFIEDVHWTWSTMQHIPGRKGEIAIGKKTGINNFCIAIPSNWERCTSCHAGYGWKNAFFDFENTENIDCLICHDTTGLYRKDPTGAGMPAEGVDLEKVAKNVGRTSRRTCGACHFFGGGGDHVKHGDIGTSLINSTRELDVHMGVDGPNMTCQFCHQATYHQIPGQAMSVSAGEGERIECGGCHRALPHKSQDLNKHAIAVACQTCHIPTFAKNNPTKIWGDWSKSGEDRKPEKDQYGLETYTKNQGEIKWGQNMVPVYAWYAGESERYILGDRINPKMPVYLTKPLGGIGDKNAKIFPFKLMEGKQPYDAVNNYLVIPKLFGGYWKHFDWNKAITDGMAAVDLPYSGKYSFVLTKMYWRINHMVAPRDKSLKCDDCHGESGRLNWSELGYKGDPKELGGRQVK
ncbi:MAG: tetrathionate reductase family octaheme c-type cytochrome [Gammaproteobacteria bacterium]|nr:tetrathionate reductase family octaheme c-type cytochrome [Gammaproteobacteria bacterium]